ncbi:MAG TPA: OmpA family protein [Terriglobales bacterium]|jgi:outer membrane protein OmpA-like peptidoglycan-associated protein|nr:OmpA family protein [Terriglobales bacterium]
MKRALFAALITAGLLVSTGCATKNYVRKETAPIINKVNELDDLTSQNTRDIRDLDTRATQGIQTAQSKADSADQKALAAGKTADEANVLATQASTRVETLHNTVANLDNYKPVVETSVHFGFDQANLTAKAKEALDQLAQEIPNQKHYILVVEGGTDSVGDANYNYQLSERRAAAVIQYLAEEHSIPAHKIYVIGLGKDKKVASNASASGRAKNRRVDVRLMTNTQEPAQSAAAEPQS